MTTGPEIYFLDVPIYACTRDLFYERLQKAKEDYLEVLRPCDERSSLFVRSEEHFMERYGYEWRYNQVVGWIRLYVLGTQIRGELWYTAEKHILRRPRRRHIIDFKENAFVMNVYPEEGSDTIYHNVLRELELVRKDPRFKKRHVDVEALLSIGPSVDWRGLVARANPRAESHEQDERVRKARRLRYLLRERRNARPRVTHPTKRRTPSLRLFPWQPAGSA